MTTQHPAGRGGAEIKIGNHYVFRPDYILSLADFDAHRGMRCLVLRNHHSPGPEWPGDPNEFWVRFEDGFEGLVWADELGD